MLYGSILPVDVPYFSDCNFALVVMEVEEI